MKFAPWQMAHTAVFHLLDGSTSVALVALSIIAQVLVLASIGVMTLDPRHRSFHDLIAGTQLVGIGAASATGRPCPQM